MTVVATAARTIAAAARVLRGPRLSVLIFHRVLPEPDPLFPGEVDKVRFRQLMELLKQAFVVLPLSEAVRQATEGRLPARAAAITFDDGYADNHDIAWPILRELGLPATVFVASGFLDGGRMWNDTVIECVRRSEQMTLELGFLGLDRVPLQTWEQRRWAIDRLLAKVKYMNLGEREAALRDIQAACGIINLPTDLMMQSEQVRALHALGIEIGAHTVSHPILSAISDEESEREIVSGRQALENLLQSPVSMFAYPNGRPGRDFAAGHVEVIRRQRFHAAFTTASGVVRGGDDLMQLRRFTPWDRDPRRWILRLSMHHASH